MNKMQDPQLIESLKEYNRQRYRQNPRHTFEIEIRSYVKRLRTLGFIVTPPLEEDLNAAIDNYLSNRITRKRIL